jgi:tRNA-specific adenosine deaminase 1
MELCMAAQDDATPWEVVRETNHTSEAQEGPALVEDSLLDGRAHFSLLGVVRRKPARTDAESTRSKSCSDKLALKQVSSLLSWQTSRLVAPTQNAYLAGLVLPEDEISHIACERAFGANGRMKALDGRSWPSDTPDRIGYQFRPFQILSVPVREIEALWKFAKPKNITPEASDAAITPRKSKPGNVSAVWTLAPSHSHRCAVLSDVGSKQLPSLFRSKTGLYESIIGGVKQGNKASSPLPRGASALSRSKLWALMSNILESEGRAQDSRGDREQSANKTVEALPETCPPQDTQKATTYQDLKQSREKVSGPHRPREEAIRDARGVLKGWIRNVGDEDWGLDVLVDPKKRKR